MSQNEPIKVSAVAAEDKAPSLERLVAPLGADVVAARVEDDVAVDKEDGGENKRDADHVDHHAQDRPREQLLPPRVGVALDPRLGSQHTHPVRALDAVEHLRDLPMV